MLTFAITQKYKRKKLVICLLLLIFKALGGVFLRGKILVLRCLFLSDMAELTENNKQYQLKCSIVQFTRTIIITYRDDEQPYSQEIFWKMILFWRAEI